MARFEMNKPLVSGVLLTVLGVVFIVLEVGGLLSFIPGFWGKAVEFFGIIITFMGVRQAILQEAENIRKMIVDFKSKTFIGVVLTAVAAISANPPVEPVWLYPVWETLNQFFLWIGGAGASIAGAGLYHAKLKSKEKAESQ